MPVRFNHIARRRRGQTVQTGVPRPDGTAQILHRQRRNRLVSVRHGLRPRRSGSACILFEWKMFGQYIVV